jgi:hypothetical protein
MKSFSKNLLVLLGVFLLLAACSRKQASPVNQDGYVGNWKVSDPQGNTFYMTLNPDGSGTSTRAGGEFGKWQFKADHIELEWMPKDFTLYFNPGQTVPLKNPSVGQVQAAPTTAVKVDEIPK